MSASVKDVREVIASARERLGAQGQRTILFLDEIHRFNKAQQDALLPAVEEGTVTLIGATTENPYFEVNSALLSRSQIYELEPLSNEDLAVIVRRGMAEIGAEVSDELVEHIASRAGGDARNALNILELAGTRLGPRASPSPRITSRTRHASGRWSTTRAATRITTSPRRSSSRCGHPTLMRPSTTSRPCSKAARTRASSRAAWSSSPPRTSATWTRVRFWLPLPPRTPWSTWACRRCSSPSPRLRSTSHGRRSRTPSSWRCGKLRPTSRNTGTSGRGDALRDTHYYGAKKLGRGQGYIYPHSDPRGFEVDNLPEPLKGKKYYRPSGSGEEKGDDHGD